MQFNTHISFQHGNDRLPRVEEGFCKKNSKIMLKHFSFLNGANDSSN